MGKSAKMLQFINYRMRVTISDSRTLIGTFMAFDKHMNIILGDCEEFRKITVKGKVKEEREEKRTLGLVIIRGEQVVSLSVEGPPPIVESRIGPIPPPAGPGMARPMGRGVAMAPGMAVAPPGLSGAPIVGIGGPAMSPAGRGRGGPVTAAPMSYRVPMRMMPGVPMPMRGMMPGTPMAGVQMGPRTAPGAVPMQPATRPPS